MTGGLTAQICPRIGSAELIAPDCEKS
eukprot:COSAG01_NODE_74347_length_217_cov_24.016949_1_plen_26_part_01